MIKRLQHFGVTVSDDKISRRFYSKVMGFPGLGSIVQEPEKSLIGKHLGAPKVRISWHQRGYGAVELFSFPEVKRDKLPVEMKDPDAIGASRLAFRTRSLDKFRESLSRNDIRFETGTDICGETHLSFSDPDGLAISVYGGSAGGIKLEKATINVVSLDESVSFYKNLLGLAEVEEKSVPDFREISPASSYKGPARVARVGINGKGIELIELSGIDRSGAQVWFPDPGRPFDVKYPEVGIKHVCFQATNTRAWADELKSKKVRIIMGPAREPTTLWVTYLLDPNGAVVELYDLSGFLTEVMKYVSLVAAHV